MKRKSKGPISAFRDRPEGHDGRAELANVLEHADAYWRDVNSKVAREAAKRGRKPKKVRLTP